ncbi:MAG TPA: orotate phosphoribosyltransferase, partial [Rhodospirillaceae bacterium]|nr:orotate phosphoribosyltransferase [Rhodospirillaceae bacterium]
MTTTASTPISRVAARILIETQSVLFKPDDPFTLTSGRKSPVYVDCRRLIAFP